MTSRPAPIAVVGIGCRFPGNATDPTKLWNLLARGKSTWTEVPADRYNEQAFYHPNADLNGSHNHRGGHFLDQNIAAFDADFFGISPIEAQAMDPQHRILLETSYEALENSGHTLESVRGSKTSVYTAIFTRDYDRNIYKDTFDIPKYHITGSGEAILSNRVSHFFDLRGPSMTLDTGCSGSMVAVHQACQSLRTHESTMALAGGVNLILNPDHMIGMSNLHMLNDHGKSYSFDSRGSGYGRGEGVATLVLKRLDDALQAGDPIRAIICNTAINQDGKTFGITLPSEQAQEALQRFAYDEACIDPRDVGYIEAHGTGTSAGDYAEIKAIANVFCANRKGPLHVGSIKSNIGHLEGASGLAGLIKAVLVLEKGFIPPNPEFRLPKPELRLSDRGITVPSKFEKWYGSGIRRASVNSFGYGGTNAHVILQQACITKEKEPSHKHFRSEPKAYANGKCHETVKDGAKPHLFVVSANTRESLFGIAANLKQWASEHDGDFFLRDLAYTLSLRRSIFQWRFSFVVEKCHEFISALRPERVLENANRAPPDTKIGFLFTGQGAQWHAMGRHLLYSHSRYRESMYKSNAILQDLGARWDLLQELSLSESESRINLCEIAQPSTTALQIALVDLLSTMGVQPRVVLGHSSGEIAAAYAAGIISQLTALRISYHRGLVSSSYRIESTVNGAMLVVGLGENEVLKFTARATQGTVSIACVNSPTSTTISGDEPAILELKEILDGLSIFNRKLEVDLAYHSHHMQNISHKYLHCLTGLEPESSPSSTEFISTVTAKVKTSGFDPTYWVKNLVSKVRYCDAIQEYARSQQNAVDGTSIRPKQILIEIGPHSALSAPTRESLGAGFHSFPYSYLPTLVRSRNAVGTLLEMTGNLFQSGILLNFDVINSLDPAVAEPVIIRDLPPYSWDHLKTYWYESHLSREHRFRQYPYHDLLGVRITSSTSLEPRWRHILSFDRLPWLQEHVIDSIVIFPGAGYICMALEAVHQLSASSISVERVLGYRLKDVSFNKALVIPPVPEKVEMQLSLSLQFTGNDTTATSWSSFRISALSQDGFWNEHCHGLVKVELASSAERDYDSYTDQEKSLRQDQVFGDLHADCPEKMDPNDYYRKLRSNGNSYGDHFAAITELSLGSCRAVTGVKIPNTSSVMPTNYMQSHLIHPSTLDALMHSSLSLYYQQLGPESVMPTFVDEIVIVPPIESTPGKSLRANTTLKPESLRSAKVDILVFNQDELLTSGPVLTIHGMELRGFGNARENLSAAPDVRNIGYQISWDVDANFLSPKLTKSVDSVPQNTNSSPEQKLEILNKASALYADSCLDAVEQGNPKIIQQHHVELVRWMKLFQKSRHSFDAKNLAAASGSEDILEQSRHQGVEGEMLDRIGHNLVPILTGNINPLQLMLDNDLIYKLYTDDSSTRCYAHMAQYLKYLCFKNPHMTILEVGAGTGGTSLPLLQALNLRDVVCLNQYDFTDITSGFFDRARRLLHKWEDRVKFKVLNIENDPVQQGFDCESYDLIVAANVLHATKNIEHTLANVHRLLKPGGNLILIEVTRPQAFHNVIFGILPGWWEGLDDGRKNNPMLSEDQWHGALSRSSFSGVEIAVHDIEGPAQISTMMVSKAVNASQFSRRPHVKMIVAQDLDETRSDFASPLSSELEKHGLQVSRTSWESDTIDVEAAYIVLDNGKKPFLVKPTAERFQKIATIARDGRNIFWISAQDDEIAIENPEKSLITGLARSSHAENENLNLVTFDIQQTVSENWQTNLLQTVTKIFLDGISTHSRSSMPREREYIYRNDQLLIPRLFPDKKVGRWISRAIGQPNIEFGIFGQSERPLKLMIGKPSTVDSPTFMDDELAQISLDPSYVQIDVKACGVNKRDVMIALGQTKYSVTLGECAGIVTAVGSASGVFKIGDRVCAWGGEPYASCARVHKSNACRLPESISYTVGASIPVAFMTAYHTLVQLADLQKDETVLICGATGDIGQAAILVAQYIGAVLFAGVSNNTERKIIIETFGVPSEHIVLNTAASFKRDVLKLTRGHGVNVTLNCSSVDFLEDSWACIASLGTLIQIEEPAAYSQNGRRVVIPLDRNATFVSFDLVTLGQKRPRKTAELLDCVMSMFENNLLVPRHAVTTMPIADMRKAFGAVQAGKQIGKVVLEAEGSHMVQIIDPSRATVKLDGNATYVIAGGLGDLGQRLCRLMASRGATHIVVLSRSDLEANEKQRIEQELQSISAETSFYSMRCDIAEKSQVERTVSNILTNGLPPVKGVFQAAMVLRDRTLASMNLDDFQAPLHTKVRGTRNLSEAFQSQPLDFFIILSSATGIIGTSGQANYVAGNTFQDAFANSQANSTVHCISLDIGMVEGANVNDQRRERNLRQQGLTPITPNQLLAFLEYAMSAEAVQSHCKQVVIGFDGRSISEVSNPNATSQTAMFSHVWHSVDNRALEKSNPAPKSFRDVILDTRDLNKIVSSIGIAIGQKISSLVAFGQGEVDFDRPMAEFGLDSLITIELKNWITREFQSPIRAFEIVDQSSISALAKKVASSSEIVQATLEESPNQYDKCDLDAPRILETSISKKNDATMSDMRLPQLPVPDLKSSLQLYLGSRRYYLSQEELESTSNAIQEFQQEGGLGQELQNRLLTRSRDPGVDNWQHDVYTEQIYLKRRDPIHPFGIFYGGHLVGNISHSQAERAAIISAAVFAFKQQVEAGTLERDCMNGEPLCMNSLHWLFNANREPHTGTDKMRKFPGNDYLVALRRGHVFKVFPKGEPEKSYLGLKDAFEAILHGSSQSIPSIATLTADERDSWAKACSPSRVREKVKSVNLINDAMMSTIEAAAFVVCLDDEAPNNPSERCNQFFLGDPSNRWSDKNLQFVVCKNGISAFVGEHAMLDGASVRQLNRFVTGEITQHRSNLENNGVSHISHKVTPDDELRANGSTCDAYLSGVVEELAFTITTALESQINLIQERFSKTFQPIEFTHLSITTFGAKFLNRHKCPSKAGYQLVIQLACRIFYSYQPPAWETVSMARFHKGRVDWIQVIQPPVAEFCAAARDDRIPLAKRKVLFFEASNAHANTMTRITRGHGFKAHMYALLGMLREDEPLPTLFKDPAWEATSVPSVKMVKTDCLEGMMLQETAFLMPEPDCIFIHYEVEDDGCLFFVQAWPGKTDAFCNALQEAADTVKKLLETDEE